MEKQIEKLAKEIMLECEKDNEPIEWADALEMAEMEIKAKGIKNYVQSNIEKTKTDKKPKTIKVSDEKTMLFNNILGCLNTIYGENVEIIKENKLILVKINEKILKIDLIEQRTPKK